MCYDSRRNTRSTQKIWCSSTGQSARLCPLRRPCSGFAGCRRKPRDTILHLIRSRRRSDRQARRNHHRQHHRLSRRMCRRARSARHGDRHPYRPGRGRRSRASRRCAKPRRNGAGKMCSVHRRRAALPTRARPTTRSRTGSRSSTRSFAWSVTHRLRCVSTSRSRTGLVLYTPRLWCGPDALRRCLRFTSATPRSPCHSPRYPTPPPHAHDAPQRAAAVYARGGA